MKKIYLHIGEHKTGSTAIQSTLQNLQNRGILKQYDFSFIYKDLYESLNASWNHPAESSTLDRVIKRLQNFIDTTQEDNLIISCEGFSSATVVKNNNIAALHTFLQGFDVKVLIYLRRQDKALESYFTQNSKQFNTTTLSSKNVASKKALLDANASFFGKENILVRVYERKNLYNNDAVDDFLQWTGLQATISKRKNTFSNPSLSPTNMRIRLSCVRQNTMDEKEKEKRLAEIQNQILQVQNTLPWELEAELNRIKSGINLSRYFCKTVNTLLALEKTPKKNTHAYFSDEERKTILDAYREENAAIAREYLGREDGVLFDESMPKERVPIDSPTTDDLVASFLPIFVHLNHKIAELEKKCDALQEALAKKASQPKQQIKAIPSIAPQHVNQTAEHMQIFKKLVHISTGQEKKELQALYDYLHTTSHQAKQLNRKKTQKKTFILGLGAQKCGTTWVYSYLNSSEHTNMGVCKEYHIWDGRYLGDASGWSYDLPKIRRLIARDKASMEHKVRFILQHFTEVYGVYFSNLTSEDTYITGDISPSYSGLNSEQLQALRDTLESVGFEVKVVFLMRAPFERCCSAIKHGRVVSLSKNIEPEPASQLQSYSYFLEYMQRNNTAVRAQYDTAITNIEKVFAPENIFYGIYEELFEDAQLQKLSEFLGVAYRPERKSIRVNFDASDTTFTYDQMLLCRIFYQDIYDYCYERFPQTKQLWSAAASLGRTGIANIPTGKYITIKNTLCQPWLKKKAYALCNEGKFEEAEELVRGIIVNNPTMAWTYYILAKVKYKREKHDLALILIQKAIDIDATKEYFYSLKEKCVQMKNAEQ